MGEGGKLDDQSCTLSHVMSRSSISCRPYSQSCIDYNIIYNLRKMNGMYSVCRETTHSNFEAGIKETNLILQNIKVQQGMHAAIKQFLVV